MPTLAQYLASQQGSPTPFGRGEQQAYDKIVDISDEYEDEDQITMVVEVRPVGAIIKALDRFGFAIWQG